MYADGGPGLAADRPKAADAFQRAADAALAAVKPQLVNKYLERVSFLSPESAS